MQQNCRYYDEQVADFDSCNLNTETWVRTVKFPRCQLVNNQFTKTLSDQECLPWARLSPIRNGPLSIYMTNTTIINQAAHRYVQSQATQDFILSNILLKNPAMLNSRLIEICIFRSYRSCDSAHDKKNSLPWYIIRPYYSRHE